MTTRGQAVIVKPGKLFTLYTSSLSRLPTTHQKALSDPNWNPTMTKEYDAQVKNKTWSLVPRPYGANVITLCGCINMSSMQMVFSKITRLAWWLTARPRSMESILMKPSVQL